MPENPEPIQVGTHHTGMPSLSGSAFWKWTASQSKWVMTEDRSKPGYQAGKGPKQQGRYDGQTVRWASVPRR